MLSENENRLWKNLDDTVTELIASMDKKLTLNNYKANCKQRKIFVFFILSSCIVVLFGLIMSIKEIIEFGEAEPTYIALPIIGLLNAILFTCLFRPVNKAIRKYEKLKSELIEKEEEYRANVASGNYEFPVEDFYAQCVSNGVRDISSPFYVNKARLLADEILKQNNIPSVYFKLYDSDEKLKAYLETGEKKEQEAKAQKKKEKEIQSRIPHEADLTEDEEIAIVIQDEAAELTGRDKREYLLNEEKRIAEEIIFNNNHQRDSLLNLGGMISRSAVKEKTTDWSITGGIANGIAGPAAGLAVAAETMRKNAAIEERNKQNQAAANLLASQVISSAYDSTNSNAIWEEEIQKLDSELEKLPTKVVLSDYDESELWQAIKIVNYKVQKCDSKALQLIIEISNTLSISDAPKGVRFATDGALIGHVYAGDLLVDTVNIPLPLYGIECEQKETVTAYCGKYSKNRKAYTVEFQSNHLWVMEI